MCGQEQATTKFDVDHYSPLYIYIYANIHLSASCIAGTLDALSPVRHQCLGLDLDCWVDNHERAQVYHPRGRWPLMVDL